MAGVPSSLCGGLKSREAENNDSDGEWNFLVVLEVI
jgi:hypothetical protein